MFYSFSKKIIIWTTCIAVCLVSFGFLLSFLVSDEVSNSPYQFCVVLDAGHGGIDGGSTGINTGITECELNLTYTNKLEKLLTSAGIKVVKTRSNLDGLYSVDSKNFKKEDMQKRKEIIENSGAQAVISIHMNKFSLQSENGAQVFFTPDSDISETFANSIKDELTKRIDNARKLTLKGDYYILKCSNIPSVLVECGFLSNPTEEANLLNSDYQDKLCYSIFCGIMKFLNINSD
ncbi:MAG: N-acetylmuramoyl-L-alanine amidase [Clostridiales bacterium]|nr:N-acetylmuramoyl-L-alanine amidase [Candidatus Apopatousia equi]